MLVLDPSKRLTIAQIKEHKWMLVEVPVQRPVLYPQGQENEPSIGEFNEQVLRLMHSLGIDQQKTIEVKWSETWLMVFRHSSPRTGAYCSVYSQTLFHVCFFIQYINPSLCPICLKFKRWSLYRTGKRWRWKLTQSRKFLLRWIMKFYPGHKLVYMEYKCTAREQGWGLTRKQEEQASCLGKPVGCRLWSWGSWEGRNRWIPDLEVLWVIELRGSPAWETPPHFYFCPLVLS